MKRNSKALCLLLAGAMTVSNCPVSVQAAEQEKEMPKVVSEETVEDTEKLGESEVSETKEMEKAVEAAAEAEEVAEPETVVEAAEEVEAVEEVAQEETVEAVDETVQEETVETAGEEIDVVEEEINADVLTKGDFSYTVGTDGGITITAYNGTGGTADIAGTFAGENVVAIGKQAFQSWYNGDHNINGKDAVSKVILPSTIKSIGEYAFWGCESLSTVCFDSEDAQLQTIGRYAFSDCSVLASITMPETLETIGEYAFSDCSTLASITMPESLKSIGERAFESCSTLGKITIPSQVSGVPDRAFLYCTSLKVVEMKSTTTTINSSAFNECKSSLTFYGDANSTAETFAAEKGFRFNRYTDKITIKTMPAKTEYFYGESLNTTGLTVEVDYESDTEPAIEVVDASACNFSGYSKSKIGKQTVIVSYAGKETTFEVNVSYNLANATVASVSDQTYTGTDLTPEVTVTGKETGITLVKDKDYILEYPDDHKNVGTATINIVGIGEYAGSTTKTYKIVQKSLKAKEISASVPTVTYNGQEQKPAPVIMNGTTKLTAEDYSIISYSSNTSAGEGTVRVEGKGNYTGTVYLNFTIEPRDINDFKVQDIADQIYSGYELTPEIVIPLDEYTNLKKGTDYTVRYKENKEIGTAKVSIEGMGNYKGTIEKTFTIKAKSLADVTVDAIADQTYTGSAMEPELSVYDSNYNVTLVKGTDYTVTYGNNVNAGTATVTIEGMGSYEGTLEKTFEIKAKKLTSTDVTVSKLETCVYSGEEQKPSFKLILGEETELVENTDYTVTYKDNVDAGTGTIVIEGMGNYKGTVEKEFTISPKKLEDVTVNDLPGYTYTGEAIKPEIDLKLEGISLKEGKDFTVSYSDNVNAGTATVTITGTGNYEGTVEKTFDIKRKTIADIGIKSIGNHIYTGSAIEPVVSLELDVYTTLTKGVDYQITYQNNVNVGTATVQVQGIGNYTGVIEKTFKITPKSIADASIVLSEEISYFDGTEKTPTVSVVSGNKTLATGTEYSVSYRNNKNIGTAVVTVKGVGNYTGSISKNFTVQAKKGSTFTVGAYKYKITSASEVAFTGLKKSTTKKVTIPAQVKIGGKKFNVTSVASKALKGKSVTSVTIGKNVKTIGSSAFEKCSKLKKITVKGTALKKVGKKAFKGINAEAKIKVPKKKLSAYQKLMKGKGQSSTVKITK